jgi:hypothetical protein
MIRTTPLLAGLLAVTWPAMCTACHKLEANQMGGYYESAAFKSQSMQLDVGAAGAADPALRRQGAEGHRRRQADKPAEFLKDAKKRHEVIVDLVQKDGVRTGHRDSLQGAGQDRPAKLIDYAGVAKLVAEGAAKCPTR